MVNPFEPFALIAPIRGLPQVIPQLATTPPEAVAPESVIVPLRPPLSRTVKLLPPLAVIAVMTEPLQRVPQLAVKLPEAVAPVRVVMPVLPPLSLQVILFPEALTEVIP